MKIRSIFFVFLLALSGTITQAAGKDELDAEVREAIAAFYQHTSAGKELAEKPVWTAAWRWPLWARAAPLTATPPKNRSLASSFPTRA